MKGGDGSERGGHVSSRYTMKRDLDSVKGVEGIVSRALLPTLSVPESIS